MNENIRSQFPILSKKINNNNLVYFDNAASTQKPLIVLEQMKKFAEEKYANVHRGLHHLSSVATKSYEDCRKDIMNFLHAGTDGNVIISTSGTDSFNQICFGLHDFFHEGDEIIISISEHHANLVPWMVIAKRRKLKIKWLNLQDDFTVNPNDLEKSITKKTKLIAINHMSNVTGAINPIKEICDIARKNNIISVIDGCQYTSHYKVDISSLQCDFYVITGHKLFGPTSIGAFYGKNILLDKMVPYKFGGAMIDEVSKENVTFANSPYKFEAGTPPIIEAYGLSAALKWYQDNFKQEYVEQKKYNSGKIFDYLSAKKNVKIYSQKGAPIISYAIDNIHPHDVATMLDSKGIATRVGHHCAMPLCEYFNVKGLIRVSLAIYNNEAEIDYFIDIHEKILRVLENA